MEAIRLPYVKLTKISHVTSKANAILQIRDEKKIIVDKYPERHGLSPPASKEFVIIKRILLSKKCLRKSYLQTQTNQPMMTISNYVLLFGVDQELTHFLINDCDGKIPVRFGKNDKHNSEVAVNNSYLKDELGEWCSVEGPPPKVRKLATNTTTSQKNCRKCSRERRAKRKSCNKKCKKRRRSERLNKRTINAPPHKEHHETELPMAQAVKLLSRGVISVCKPSLDCEVPKEVDPKRSQQDADRNIIEIIDDLSCMSGNSVIIEEPNQIPIMVESEDDETHGFLKNETRYSMNKATMTEDYPPPIPALKKTNVKRPLFKEIKYKTPDKLLQQCSIKPVKRDSDLNENESNKISKYTNTDFKKEDQETMTKTASKSRLQIDSNFLGIFKEKSNAQNQTDTDPNIMAITQEHVNKVNVEDFFNVNKITSGNVATIDESLTSINVDELSGDSTADTNLHRNIVETTPMVDIKCTPINCLFQNSDIEDISKQLYELIECRSSSEITSSSDRNQCNNATIPQPIGCTTVQQMLLKDLQLMVQKFYEFSHSKNRKIADCQSDLPTESTMRSKVDDRNSESSSISAKSSDNLTEGYNSTEAEKATPACFDPIERPMHISKDKLRPETKHGYSIKDVSNINSTRQLSQITSRNKISMYLKTYFTRKKKTMKKALKAKKKSKKIYRRPKNDKEKTIDTYTKNLARKPRLEKKLIDSVGQPFSTVENDKKIPNCDEMTNNEIDLSEISTERDNKLKDVVKNSSDPHEKLNPATKRHIDNEINEKESSEVTISNNPGVKNTKKGMREEIKQILVFIDKNILIVDPVQGVSINPNTSKTSYDGSHLNTSNLVNSEKQTDAVTQLGSDKAFNKTSDHLTMNKNNTDTVFPDKVKKATIPRKRKQPQRRITQNKVKKVDIIQKSSTIKKCNSTKSESASQLMQLRVVCERYPVKINTANTQKKTSTVQEEHCDSTTAVIENRPEISCPVKTYDSQEIVTTDLEYFKSYPETAEAERQIINDWRSKTAPETVDAEMNININNEIHTVNNELICVEENPTTKDSEKEILNSDYSIDEIEEELQIICGEILSSPPHHKSSHLPITAAPTIQETATRIAQPLREPNNTEEIVFRTKLPKSTNVEYEKLVFDAILNTENSVEVENQEEYSVEQYIPKNNSEVIKGDIAETVSNKTCDFDFKPVSIGSPLELETVTKELETVTKELETVTKLTSDVVPDTQPVNLSSLDNAANSKSLSNTKISDSETVSSTTISNSNDLEKTSQSQNTDREEQFMVSNSTNFGIPPDSYLTPLQKTMNGGKDVNSNSKYCDADLQDLVVEENPAKNDLVQIPPDKETNRETATLYKNNPAEETTPVSSHNITASEYILRKQQKSAYVELNTAVPDPRLRGDYLCFEEAVMLSDVNKVEIFKNISAKQNLAKKKFKKRVEKDLRELVYKKDENNLDDAPKQQTSATEHKVLRQRKKEKIPPKKKIGLIPVSGKTPESSLKTRLRSATNVFSSSSPPKPQSVDTVLDTFSDGAPQICPPPSTNPQLLASSRLFSPIKSLESLSSSLLHNLTEKAMAYQRELKSKVESKLQLEKPFPKGLTVSLCSNDTVHRHSDQPSPSVSLQNVTCNQIPPFLAITDCTKKVPEPKTIHDTQKLRLKDIRKKSKHDSVIETDDHTLLSAIQNTQIERYSNQYHIESSPNDTRNIEVLTAHENTTKGTDQQCIGRKVTRSPNLLQNLKEDVAPQREGLDLSKAHQNAIDGKSNKNSNITGNNYRSQRGDETDKTVNRNSNTNYKHYYRKRFNVLAGISEAHRRQAHCGPRETQVTQDPNYLNPIFPRIPAVQQHYGSSIYPVCLTPNITTNNIPTVSRNNHFVDYQVFQKNSNNLDQFSHCNPVSNYQHSFVNLQSAQSSQRQVTNPHHINPNSTQSAHAAHSMHSVFSTHTAHPAHSQIRFPPPQGIIGPNMFATSYSSWINPIHPHPPQEHIAFPPLDAQKQQFLQNYAKRVHLPPPQAQPKKISQRRSSTFQ